MTAEQEPRVRRTLELRGKNQGDSTAFLVGAAGFEPTTCSTQNCRATRLRYTPIVWETPSIHAYGLSIKVPSPIYRQFSRTAPIPVPATSRRPDLRDGVIGDNVKRIVRSAKDY